MVLYRQGGFKITPRRIGGQSLMVHGKRGVKRRGLWRGTGVGWLIKGLEC